MLQPFLKPTACRRRCRAPPAAAPSPTAAAACLPACPARLPPQGDGRVLVALFFLLWMGVLFWVMAAVAEDFLVPALEVRPPAVCFAAVLSPNCCPVVAGPGGRLQGEACRRCAAAIPGVACLPASQPNRPACLQPPVNCPSPPLTLHQFLAYWLGMAPDVAGVTLFAFASGAPDLFTQIAAVAAGGHVDQELAIRWGCGWGFGLLQRFCRCCCFFRSAPRQHSRAAAAAALAPAPAPHHNRRGCRSLLPGWLRAAPRWGAACSSCRSYSRWSCWCARRGTTAARRPSLR